MEQASKLMRELLILNIKSIFFGVREESSLYFVLCLQNTFTHLLLVYYFICRDAPPVMIVNPGEGIVVMNNTSGLAVSKVVILVAALVGATCAAVAVISFYLARER